jgi:VIT1/CCC1 family predicted Fe2+/Mn2+ transporter
VTPPRRALREYFEPTVIGLADGILTALTLAAGRLAYGQGDPISAGLALRLAAAALVSSAFVLFVSRYAELRGELVHAERQLNLAPRGRLATTRLGRAVLRESTVAAVLGSACSFVGALAPLGVGAMVPRPTWLAIAVALAALAALGFGLAWTLAASPVRWVAGLTAAGVVLSFVGAQLRIV